MTRKLTLLLCLTFLIAPLAPAGAWAEPALQTPVQLGESDASVRQKLGEPSKVVDGSDGNTIFWYMSQGFSLDIDPATKTVTQITLMGPYHSEGWVGYSGKVISDIAFSTSIDQVVQVLGSSYGKDELMEEMGGDETSTYYWEFETYTFGTEFWQADHIQNGQTYPKGSLKGIEIIKKGSR